MSEDVGSLVVRVAMDNSNFQQGVQNLNRSLKVVQSEFKTATAGLGEHGKGIDGLKAKTEMLSKSIDIQKEVVEKYKEKLKDSKDTLEKNSDEHVKLKEKVESAKKAFEESREALGANSEETKKLKAEYDELNKQYDNSEERIRNNVRSMENWEIKTNNATTKLKNLESELSNVNQELEKSQNKWLNASESLENTSKKFDKVGKGISGVGDGILKLTAPLAAVGVASLKVGMDFESAMSEVGAISGATGEDLVKLEGAAREMGAKTSKSAKESADALKYMALAGWDVNKSIAGLEPILRLSEAGNIDLGRASDLVTDSMASLGVQVGDLGGYLDRVAKAQAKANTSADGMLEAYVIAGGMFKALNTDLDTSATLIGILANRGIKGSEAGNKLSATLVNLSGSTDKTRAIFNELGIEIYDQQGKYIGIESVLEKVKTKFDGMTESQKNYYMAQLVGKTQIDTMSALMSGLGEEYYDLKNDISNADGALLDMAETMQDNTKGDWVKLKSAMEEVGIKISGILIPTARDFIGIVNKVVDEFSNLHEGTQSIIVKTGLLTVGLGGLLSVGGRVISGAGTLIGVAGKLTGALGASQVAAAGVSATTTAVGTAATTAAGVGTAGGLAGLATTLGGAAVAAAPFVLAGAAIVGTGYVIHKSMSQEVVPSVDLFADKVENASVVVGNSANQINESYSMITTTISESTKQAVGSYLKLDESARQSLDSLYINSTVITEAIKNDMISKYAEMGQQITTKLDEDKVSNLKILEEQLSQMSSMSEERKAEILANTNQHYENKKQIVENGQAHINEIYQKASEEKREITYEERKEIEAILNGQREDAINLLSEQETESKVILERMKDYDGRITAEQASEHIKQLNDQRDKVIKSANEECTETIKWAIKQRDELGTISAEECEAIITEAKRKKEETIKKADETKEGAIKKMKQMNSDLEDLVSTTTGNILTKWDRLAKWWDEWNPGVKKFFAEIGTVFKGAVENSDPSKYNYSMPNYERGTKGHPGGLARFAERNKRELIIFPNGSYTIAEKEQIANLPRGTHVIPNDETENILKGIKGTKMPSYANGTGSTATTIGVVNTQVQVQTFDFSKGKESILEQAKKLGEDFVNTISKAIDNNSGNLDKASNEIANIVKKRTEELKEGLKQEEDVLKDKLEKLRREEELASRNVKRENNYAIKDEYYAKKKAVEDQIKLRKDQVDKEIKELQRLTEVSKEEIKKELDTRKEFIDNVNNLHKQIVSALKAKYEEEYRIAEESLNEEIDKLQEWKEESEKRINSVYDTKIAKIREATEEQVQAIQKEIEAIDNAEKSRERSIQNQVELERISYIQSRLKQLLGEDIEIKSKYSDKDIDSLSEIDRLQKSIEETMKQIADIDVSEKFKAREEVERKELDRIEEIKARLKELSFIKMEDLITEEQKIEEIYNKRLKIIEESANTRIRSIQNQIDELDNILKQEERQDQDEDEQKKINRLKDKIEYEHNDFNREQLQKELDRLEKEREKRKKREEIEKKKDELKSEIEHIQANLKQQKDKIEEEKRLALEKQQFDKQIAEERRALEEELQNILLEQEKRHNQDSIEEKKKNLQEKLQLETELADLLKQREERAHKESIEAQKKALQEKMQDLKENSARKIAILEKEKQEELYNIKEIYTTEKKTLEKRMIELKEFHKERTKEANLQAEAEQMIMKNSQDEIIRLLHSYAEPYKIAGNTLGEKLVDGFRPHIDEINRMIDSLYARLAAVSSAASSSSSSSSFSGSGSSGGSVMGASSTKINNNNITVNSPKAISHSEAFRKATNAARSIANMFK